MKRFLSFIASLAIVTFTAVPAFAAPPATQFDDPQDEASSQALCQGSGGTWDAGNNVCTKTGEQGLPTIFRSVANLLLFIIGSIGVIMLIIGGLRYVTSNGDQSAVTSAKNTILYAIIGIVIAFAAYAIVNFVIGSF